MVGAELGRCYKCKDAYYLNESGLCDKVITEECDRVGSLQKDSQNAYAFLKNNPFILGCISCKDTFYSVSFPFAPEICIENTSLKSSLDSLKANFVINNCDVVTF